MTADELPAKTKTNALDPIERGKPCDHEAGFIWNGRVPCTGIRVCRMCNARMQ